MADDWIDQILAKQATTAAQQRLETDERRRLDAAFAAGIESLWTSLRADLQHAIDRYNSDPRASAEIRSDLPSPDVFRAEKNAYRLDISLDRASRTIRLVLQNPQGVLGDQSFLIASQDNQLVLLDDTHQPVTAIAQVALRSLFELR